MHALYALFGINECLQRHISTEVTTQPKLIFVYKACWLDNMYAKICIVDHAET